jgi:hypothetical protein
LRIGKLGHPDIVLSASVASILVAFSRAPGQRIAYWQIAETLGLNLDSYPKACLVRCKLALSACTNLPSNALSLLNPLCLLYLGAWSLGALSHFLSVLRDSPVRLAISLFMSCSRNFIRLTLPIVSMMITFFLSC